MIILKESGLRNSLFSEHFLNREGQTVVPWQQTLYEENRLELFSLALSICGCADSAEDAVHDAFLRLQNRPKPELNTKAYVFKTVRNAAIDMRKSETRQRSKNVSLFHSANLHASVIAQSEGPREHIEYLREMIDKLPESEKEIVVLKVFATMTFEQIAKIVGRPAKTVETKYRRALQLLRRRYQTHTHS